jgi:tight adherence protein C
VNIALVLGSGTAAGILLALSGAVPARTPLVEALAALHRPLADHERASHENFYVRLVGRPLARTEPGRRFARWIGSDLRITERSTEELIAKQILCALAGLFWMPATAALIVAGGVRVSLVFPVWMSLGLATAGACIPVSALKNAAGERRRAFRHALGCFLDLVAVRLAGGAGIESALALSAASGRGWAFAELRQALTEARLMGEPPWAGLDRLGAEIGVDELKELAASVALAGDEGARVRRSVTAKARTIRTRSLADAEGAAQAASERMSLPIVLLMVGFVIFLGFPAVNQVLTGL